MADAYADIPVISAKAAAYCEALWASDTEALAKLFHPRANLYGSEDDALAEYTGEQWFEIVRARAPGQGTAPYKVLNVSQPAPELGAATVECSVTGMTFTDILNFVKIDGDWRVIAKLFHAHH